MPADDRLELGWIEDVLKEATLRTVDSYKAVLSSRIESETDLKRREVLELVATVCSFHLRAPNAHDPFGPMWRVRDQRSLIPADLGDDELARLSALSGAVEDSELRARICDTLWVSKRDHHAARNAVKLYVDSATKLARENHHGLVERFERALRLAKLLGGGGREALNHAAVELFNVLQDAKLDHRNRAELMKLVREFRVGDGKVVSELAAKFASDAEAAGALFDAIDLLDVKASADASRSAETERRETLEKLAEIYVMTSERTTPASAGAEWLAKAIKFHEQVGNREKARELHERLVVLQAQVLEEMGTLSAEVDLGQAVDAAKEHVRGKSWPQVLHYFAVTLAALLDPEQLRERVQRQMGEHPLLALIPRVKVDHSGRVVHHQPAALGGSTEESEAGLFGLICQDAGIVRQLVVQGQILPARDVILSEHSFSFRDLIPLLRHSPFVPLGREVSFAKGLQAGFDGDWLTAFYLLMPQVENALRNLLESQGVRVRTVDPEGAQEYFSLGRTLNMNETAEFFGPSLTFELRSLLTEPAGENLRNEGLHGILPDAYCQGAHSIQYFWWLVLRLCIFPLFREVESQEPPEEGDEHLDAEKVTDEK
jgi:hypothetical protein